MNDFKGYFKSTMTSMVKDAIFGSSKISQSLGSSLHGGGKKSGIGGFVSSFIGGLFGRASGGPVTGNKSYLVGEQGPELFTPSGNGRITRNGEGQQWH